MLDSSGASPAMLRGTNTTPETPRDQAPDRARVVAIVFVALIVLVWLVFLRPPSLGGSTRFVTVTGSSMVPTLRDNDLVVLSKQSTYAVGDIIAYSVKDDPLVENLRVIHRVIGGNPTEGYQTQGDNRETVDPWRPVPADILGRKVVRLPKLGIVFEGLKTPVAFLLLAMLWGVVLLWRPRTRGGVRGRDTSRPPAGAGLTPSRQIRPTTVLERTMRRDLSHYDAVARSLRRRFLLEDDHEARRALRALAFELAAVYHDRDRRFNREAFLDASGAFLQDGDRW